MQTTESTAVTQTAEPSVNRLSFEKIFHFPKRLQNLIEDKEEYPIHAQIGSVNFCNHGCTFCFAARTKFDAKGIPRVRIDVERLMGIIEEMHEYGLLAVTLVGAGEPTLHPRIHEIIEGIARRGVEVAMFTNGSCVTGSTAQAIADYSTFVRFSLTGATQKIHRLVHGTDDFDRVVANIEKIVAARKGRLPTLGTQFVLASYSAPDVVKGAILAKSLGLDYYEIKPAYPAPDKPDQLPNTLSTEEAGELMLEAKQYEDEDFKIYAKMEQTKKVFTNVDDREYNDCPGHKVSAIIEADFDMYICSNQKIPEFSFGNLSDKSFKEVWQGRRRRQILEKLDVHKCIPRCRQDPLNRIVHDIRTGRRSIPVDLPKPDAEMHVCFL